MKLATFEAEGRISYGLVKDDGIVDAGCAVLSPVPRPARRSFQPAPSTNSKSSRCELRQM